MGDLEGATHRLPQHRRLDAGARDVFVIACINHGGVGLLTTSDPIVCTLKRHLHENFKQVYGQNK